MSAANQAAVFVEREALARETVYVQEACRAIEAMPVESQIDLNELAEGTKEAKRRLKELEQARRALTDPITADLEEIRARYRPAEAAYTALEKACKARLLRHDAETRAAQQAAQQAAATAFQAGDAAAGHAAIAAVPAPAKAAGVSVRHVLDFEVRDADSVPRELCSPDPAKIRAYLATLNQSAPGLPVSGLHIFQKAIAAVRA